MNRLPLILLGTSLAAPLLLGASPRPSATPLQQRRLERGRWRSMVLVRPLSTRLSWRGVAEGRGEAPRIKQPVSGVLEYELQTSAGDRPAQKMHQKLWFKGQRYRLEIESSKGKSVTLGGPDGLFLFKPGSHEATRFARPPRPTSGIPGLALPDVSSVKQMQKVGSEKIGRFTTQKYERIDTAGVAGTGKDQEFTKQIWVNPELPVPVRYVTIAPTSKVVQELKEARLNVPLDDSLFQLPKNIKISDLTKRK